MAQTVRLDKFLSERGMGTRTEVKKKIRIGKASVNGELIRSPETKINPESDIVELDGSRLRAKRFEYFMFYKPAGLVTATEDTREKTVMDGIREAAGGREAIRFRDFFPAGRLDKDTEGLLLITNDGELSHRLLSPKRHIPKTYYVLVKGSIDEEMQKAFATGISLGKGETAMPSGLKILSCAVRPGIGGKQAPFRSFPSILEGEVFSEAEVTIYEGKYHQVKRMFEAAGVKVQYLKRLSMGSLVLDESLSPGEYRRLSEKEIDALKEETGYVGTD